MNLKQKKNMVVTAGSVAAVGTLILGGALISKSCNKNKVLAENTTGTTSTFGTTTENTTTSSTTTKTSESTKYSLDRINIDYSAPTRNSDETNEEGYVTNEYGYYPDETITVLRETTDNDYVEVISGGDIQDTIETVSYETSVPTKETDIQGTVAETTEYTAPTGEETLPIEPTRITISLDDLEYEETKESNNTKKSSKNIGKKLVLTLNRRVK